MTDATKTSELNAAQRFLKLISITSVVAILFALNSGHHSILIAGALVFSASLISGAILDHSRLQA